MKFDFPDLDWRESHDLLTRAVSPRPVALVSTVGEDGVYNLAPFAQYGIASIKPAIVFIGIANRIHTRQKKDTLINIEFSRDFVINAVDESLVKPMHKSAKYFPIDVDEFEEAGLTALKSDLVKAPRVAESPISLECKVSQIIEFGEFPDSSSVVMGQVLRLHVRDDLLVNKAIKTPRIKAIAFSGDVYYRTTDTFRLRRHSAPGKD